MGRTSRTITGALAALALAPAGAGAAVQVSQSGWQWGNPTPQGTTVRAIDVAAGRVFAAGDDGTALRSDDGGATWTGLPTGTSRDLVRVQAVTPDTVVVLGGDGCVVRRSDDGGATFRKVFVLTETGCPDPVAAVSFVDPQTGYLVLRDGNVLRTADGGQTFSRGTALPGTPAGAGGGDATPADAVFTSPDAGLVFLTGGAAYRSTDAGASWTPEPDVPAGADVRGVRAVSATTMYAYGAGTLLRSTDAGQTWQSRAAGAGAGTDVTGIGCAGEALCLLTTARGDHLLRTEDGGATAESITASTAPLYAAGFATATRAVAAGAGGATAVSDDGGRNYAPVGADIAGSFPFGLRAGPSASIAYALGARGRLARTADGGATWTAINVATSADLRDASFAGAQDGYALDARGGLFRTANGGGSWQPIDPGTTTAPRAVLATGGVVLLAGPRGVRRATGGGRFDLVAAGPARRAAVSAFDRAGSALFAFGTTAIVRSTDRGRTWRAVAGPRGGARRAPLALRSLDMTSARNGYALDATGRVWRTRDGGRRWAELPAVGTGAGLALAFGSSTAGYLTLRGYPADGGVAYVLRTTDGGRRWRPQRIAAGAFAAGAGVVAPSAARAFALTSSPAAGGVFRSLFATSSGGDAGKASTVTLRTARRTLARAGRVTVDGVLRGAQGGESVVVASRSAGGRWREQVVTVGANGGRFTAALRVTAATEVVARWAGDSGRQGAGSAPLRIGLRR